MDRTPSVRASLYEKYSCRAGFLPSSDSASSISAAGVTEAMMRSPACEKGPCPTS